MSLPTEITVPVKVDPQVAWGRTSTLGAATGAAGLLAALLAFLLGDRTPETMAAIVGGTVTGLGSILVTLVGRYLQAHAGTEAALQRAAGTASGVMLEAQPILQSLSVGDAASIDKQIRMFEERMTKVFADVLERTDGGPDQSDDPDVGDESAPTALDAVPPPLAVPGTAGLRTVDDGTRPAGRPVIDSPQA